MGEFYNSSKFIEDMIKLIVECNKCVISIYNNDMEIEYKDDKSPLTNADKECNKIICSHLAKISTNINKNILIISEEHKNKRYEERKKYDYVWLVDPIDGTKEFIKKNGQFTINIGLIFKGEPVFGIVSIPVSGEIYYGIKDIGSFKIEQDVHKKLIINEKNLNNPGIRIVASSSHINKDTEDFIKKYKMPSLVNIGSSIKLLYIAENKADIYPRIAPTSEWDTCAAHAVVKYAGGRVVIYEKNIDLKFLKEVNYNKEKLLNPFFICY